MRRTGEELIISCVPSFVVWRVSTFTVCVAGFSEIMFKKNMEKC